MCERKATGLNAAHVLSLCTCVLGIVASFVLPWFAIPSVGHGGAPFEFAFYALEDGLQVLLERLYGTASVPVGISSFFQSWCVIVRYAGLFGIALMIAAAVCVWQSRRVPAWISRLCLFASCVAPCSAIALVVVCNDALNGLTGQPSTLLNLTSKGFIRLTYAPLGLLFFGLGTALLVGRLMGMAVARTGERQLELNPAPVQDGTVRTRLAVIVIAVAVPLMMGIGVLFLGNRSQVFIGLCLVIAAMVPFAWTFEHRRPQAREVVLIAVMTALSVAGRLALFMVPQCKPTSALVIISGIWLGPEAGCLVGMLSAFTSNFFFGQGPWTPWQMFGFGLIGFLAGVLFKGRRRIDAYGRLFACAYGFLAVMFVYGPIVDTSSVLTNMGIMNPHAFAAIYLAGVPFNFIHAASTVFFLFLLVNPMGKKLARIQRKYGLTESSSNREM